MQTHVLKRNPRDLVRSLFSVGVKAADPSLAVRLELTANPLPELAGGRYIIFAIGKAACTMVGEALRHIPPGTPYQAFAVTNPGNLRKIPNCVVVAAGHPVPNESGLRAGLEVKRRLQSAGRKDVVLCLISGGGSALLTLPPPGIPLVDIVAVNELLLSHGFDIHKTNLVRQQVSQLKGGRLAHLASPASVRSLIISDVIGNDPRCIASGPTSAPLGSSAEAIQLLKDRDVWPDVPVNVRNFLKQAAQVSPAASPQNADNRIIASNWRSLEAIKATAPDLSPTIASDRLCGDVGSAVHQIISDIRTQPQDRRLLVWGGETTVMVSGDGKGGRNQELALRVAIAAREICEDWVFLSGGTDGRDGPTDAAGGLVDSGTVTRIAEAGEDVGRFLANSDSYRALRTAGDLLVTGATGTNVADIQLFLRCSRMRGVGQAK